MVQARVGELRLVVIARGCEAEDADIPVEIAGIPTNNGRGEGRVNNFEARAAGSALLVNNLGARLDAVREDALYAKVLFLGAPGAIMAVLLTLIVATSGVNRRRRDEALLRARGASVTQLMELSAAEAMSVGLIGVLAGIGLAELSSRLFFTKQRTMILSVAAATLSLGLAGSGAFGAEDTSTTGAASPATGAEESPTTEGSAKMGKEEGTHTETGQGVTPEQETSKIVQPPRASPTTGGETATEQPTTGGETPTEQPTTSDQTGQ